MFMIAVMKLQWVELKQAKKKISKTTKDKSQWNLAKQSKKVMQSEKNDYTLQL